MIKELSSKFNVWYCEENYKLIRKGFHLLIKSIDSCHALFSELYMFTFGKEFRFIESIINDEPLFQLSKEHASRGFLTSKLAIILKDPEWKILSEKAHRRIEWLASVNGIGIDKLRGIWN